MTRKPDFFDDEKRNVTPDEKPQSRQYNDGHTVDINSKFWYIHGKKYDLTHFAKHHPGGEYIIMVGQGRDCTEMFESVHAPSKIDILSSLAKFEVKEEDPTSSFTEDLFLWDKENGFYGVLSARVRDHFKGKSHKATWFVIFKIYTMLLLNTFFWYKAISTGNWAYGLLSGALTGMIGFNVMHDASHSALSKKPWVNYVGGLYSSWMFWNFWIWIQHHCYGHHSYTAMYYKDPDVVNVDYFFRKHERSKPRPYQHWYSLFAYLFFPNQHFAQVLWYQLAQLSLFNNSLGGLKLKRGLDYVERDNLIVMVLSAFYHFIIPAYFLPLSSLVWICVAHFTVMGFGYYINVAPNHDTVTSLNNHADPSQKIDWGEHQVRTSGDHSTKDTILDTVITHLWGGMNYQIEHHLFPSVNHTHYRDISRIVERTCKEFNIPYDNHHTFASALMDNVSFLKFFSDTPQLTKEQFFSKHS